MSLAESDHWRYGNLDDLDDLDNLDDLEGVDAATLKAENRGPTLSP